MKQFISYLLLIAGIALTVYGLRDWFESRTGQAAAARDFRAVAERSRTGIVRRVSLGETVGKLSIPRLHTDLFVVEGDDTQELRRGPGHLPGTVMPGMRGNSVIAAHRDTHFRVLKDIRKGDDIVIETANGVFRYRVISTRIVSPDDTASLAPARKAVLHLITCYPFYWMGPAPKRFIVEAALESD